MRRRIGTGNGNSYLDIGIAPPLESEVAEKILDSLSYTDFDDVIVSFPPPGIVQIDDLDPEHTVISFNTDDAHRAFPDRFKRVADELAHRTAYMLVAQGENVTVLSELVQIDFQTPIFGKDADFQREMIRRFESSKQQ